MNLINQKQQEIIQIILQHGSRSSSQIHAILEKEGWSGSLVTVKRLLSEMVEKKLLAVSGAGRSTEYNISIVGRVCSGVNAREYCAIEPDKRFGQTGFNFKLFNDFPENIFSVDEFAELEKATKGYQRRITDLPEAIRKKELERLIIELSWKSSKIEGNTYTLLDTEKLILENKTAPGKTKEEAKMILNHKFAFEFTRAQSGEFKTISRPLIEELHKKLVDGLGVSYNLRKKPVGITGSIYRPLDNGFQIAEALKSLIERVNALKSPYAKALLAKAGIAYIQPFDDGNKRTARLLANAILMAHDLAPLSYRSVDEKEYRESILVFYELNSIIPFKKIFISQYIFAAHNYAAA